MSDLTRAERAELARIEAAEEAEWMTRPARAAFLRRFDREVDPDEVLAPEERARRVQSARREYFTELGRRSAEVRWGRAIHTAARPEPTQQEPPGPTAPEQDPWDGFTGRLF